MGDKKNQNNKEHKKDKNRDKNRDNNKNQDKPDTNRLIQERMRKLKEIRELGINPYPYSYEVTHHAKQIHEEFEKLKPEEKTKSKVSVAGRIMLMRPMGKAAFMHIQDQSGKIQLYLRQDDIGKDKIKFLKKLDVGDYIGVKGTIFKTKTGEVTIYVDDYELLCKTLRPLPEKFHGLKDTELRYRKRYLDLIMNPDVKQVFIKRAKVIQKIRDYFNERSYLEVETPILQPIYGGANARPFKSHLNALNMDVFLRVSNELYLKRLLVGGFERVYEFAKDFRNEDIDRTHNPEFSMVEYYQAYADYNEIMDLTEDLIVSVAEEVFGKLKFQYEDKTINFKKPWKRMTMRKALIKHAQIDVDKLTDDELKDLLRSYAINYEGDYTKGLATQLLFEELVEDKLIQPTFITDHPIETTPLCKPLRKGDQMIVERFELFIAGMEFANAYSELNDPILQRKLLEDQAKQLRAGSEEAHPMDEDFIECIEYGMPPTGGCGIGVDRLIILLTENLSIRDVLLFPFMKPIEE
ncbi:lysine--tRNA ligase [Nanoarchaeota archaeon]